MVLRHTQNIKIVPSSLSCIEYILVLNIVVDITAAAQEAYTIVHTIANLDCKYLEHESILKL